jgi:insulysin
MIEFFSRYFSPASPKRGKLSVHLYAQSTVQSKEKIADLLKALDLPNEKSAKLQAVLLQKIWRQDTAGLKAYLEQELKLPSGKVAAVLEAAKSPEMNPNFRGPDEIDGQATANGISKPVFIKDVRGFKAGLMVTPGPRPAMSPRVWEEAESKL